MEQHDREYRDMLEQGLSGVEPGSGLEGKVQDGIAHQKEHLRRRNLALGTVAVLLVFTVVFSSVTPVFGRNGTLPQVLTAMAAERQARTVARTLGTASVQQTGVALQTSATTLQAVSNSTLSETDSLLALIIANRSGRSVEDVLALRAQGLGWGRIMAQLGVSGSDISAATSQVQTAAATAVASTASAAPVTPSAVQDPETAPAVSNRNGTKVVVNGEITVISPSAITVAGKVFAIVPGTELKYHGKAILPADILTKLAAGKLYATVQGTQLSTASLQASLVIVQDGAATEEPGETATSNAQQARGKVTVVSATLLHIDGYAHDIVLTAATKVEQTGAGKVTIADIKVGQTVQVHVSVTGTVYTATQVHIEDKDVKSGKPAAAPSNPATSSAEQPDAGNKVSNAQQARGKVIVVSATLLHIDGYTHDIVLTAATKVEQTGAGKVTIADIKVGQTVQVHVSVTGTTYTATQVHIEDKDVKSTPEMETPTDPSVKTWQGTVASVVLQSANNPAGEPMIGVVALAESGQPTVYWVLPASVLRDAGGATLTLAQLQALPNLTTQKVTIQGKLLADGSVDIIKLTVTTTGTGNTANPGKGNGKDKSGKH